MRLSRHAEAWLLLDSALGSWAQVAGDIFEAVVVCNSELLDACKHLGPYKTLW